MRLSSRARIAWILAIAALLGAVLGTAPANAVVNGETVSPAPGWMVAVYTNIAWDEEKSCSGSVIAPQWVLTAVHCVVSAATLTDYTKASGWKKYRPKSQTSTSEVAPYSVVSSSARRVAIGASDASQSTQQGLRSISTNPKYSQTFFFERNANGTPTKYKCNVFDSGKHCRHVTGVNLTNDFALLRLNQATSATPIYLGPLSRPDVTAYGYGYHTTTNASDALLRRTVPSMTARVCSQRPSVLCATPQGSWTAPGDSGGPWVQTQNGGALVQVGITSYGLSDGTFEGGANVGAGLAWITSKVGALPTPPTGSSSVLIAGGGDSGDMQTNEFVQSVLTQAGYQVTMDETDALPADLSPFGQIWDISTTPLSTDDQSRLIDFAKSGRGVYLTGERPCCEDVNASTADVVNGLVLTVGGVQVGGLGDPYDQTGSVPVNSTATGQVATTPFPLDTITVSAPGGMANVSGDDVLASTEPNGQGVPVGAVWGPDTVYGGGRLVVLMDINWGEAGYADLTSAGRFAQNAALFLGGLATPPAPPVATPAAVAHVARTLPGAHAGTAAP